jgi:hypothetical protein
MDVLSHRLNTDGQFEGFQFTNPTTSINLGNANSSYKEFKSMNDKSNMQLGLAEKLTLLFQKRSRLKSLTATSCVTSRETCVPSPLKASAANHVTPNTVVSHLLVSVQDAAENSP